MKKELIIKRYYKLVDKDNVCELLKLFSDDIIYIRAGKEIRGFKNLDYFYKKDRKLNGNHKIKKIINSKDLILVTGNFDGKNSLNKKIKVDFIDIFSFNKNNKIKRRETYLGEGFEKIK